MSKPLSLTEVAVYWDKVTMNDRVLALNSINVIGQVARQLAGFDWEDVPSDIQRQLKGLH